MYTLACKLAEPHFAVDLEEVTTVPISSLVITFHSLVEYHSDSIEALRAIPEVELGESGGSRLAIVVDTADRQRDQEIWNTIRELPGVLDLAVVMIAFDEDQPYPENDSIRTQT